MSRRTWLVADSLYCEAQRFCSHLNSYSHYLFAAGEEVLSVVANSPVFVGPEKFLAWSDRELDVVFMLDRYDLGPRYNAKVRIAQVAAICNPMPWDVRKPDGSPAYDLVISSIPHMVEQARAKGCEARYMPLAFDTRARVCGMGVERDLDCIFIGTVGPNHQRRSQLLAELRDVVTVMPPVFGREYFKTLARAKVVFHCHAEWARGAANAMRLYEAAGMGCRLVFDGYAEPWHGDSGWIGNYGNAKEAREEIRMGVASLSDDLEWTVYQRGTYENRIPQLITWAKELLR